MKQPVQHGLSSVHNLGKHLLAEFYDCDPNVLNNVELIESVMTEAAVECGATVVQKNFHLFSPHGVSGVVIISESHLAIHTWPEFGYAAVDLFTCGDSCQPEVAYDYLREHFHAGHAYYSELKRGPIDPHTGEMVKVPFQIKAEKQTLAQQQHERQKSSKTTGAVRTLKQAGRTMKIGGAR